MDHQSKTMPDGTREWVVSGDAGAVNFLAYPPSGSIDMHSCVIGIHGVRRQMRGQHKVRCDVLDSGKCYSDTTFAHAAQLWKDCQHGRDEDRIWRELEGWYFRSFGQEK